MALTLNLIRIYFVLRINVKSRDLSFLRALESGSVDCHFDLTSCRDY